MYFHTARVPSPSGWKRQPAPKRAKNHGPRTIVIPTDVGGRQETYSLTMLGEIGPAKEDRVKVRTPTPGTETVLPATLPHAALVERLRATDAAVLMKLGRHLPKVRAALAEAGLPAAAWDLYCGVGGFAFHLARAGVRDVWGMESSAEAVAAARETAAELGLADRVRFSAGDATSALSFEKRRAPEALSFEKRRSRPDAVVVNPPRRGIGAELADALEDSGVPTVLYSSCNPATLAQDLARMPSYRVARVQVFDMFPQTRHAEVLTLLTRR